MRKIKFRGHTGACWVYGNLIQYKDSSGNDHAQIEETVWDDFGCWDVDPESVGQFTGMVDKNGKEIFEGDVVKAKSQGQTGTCEVKWGVGTASFFLLLKSKNHPVGIWHLRGGGESRTQETLEVIGNTFENEHSLDKG